jgi:hypothetical protein
MPALLVGETEIDSETDVRTGSIGLFGVNDALTLWKLAIVVFLGCAKGDQMKHLEALWTGVTASATAASEETAVEQVWHVVADEHISVQLRGKDTNGARVDMMTARDVENIESVEVTFSKGGQTRTFVWSPIDIENAFILFREK